MAELRTIEEIVEAVVKRLGTHKLLTVQSIAVLCDVDPDTVRDWITSGKLRTVRLGERTQRVRVSDLNKFLEDRETA